MGVPLERNIGQQLIFIVVCSIYEATGLNLIPGATYESMLDAINSPPKVFPIRTHHPIYIVFAYPYVCAI